MAEPGHAADPPEVTGWSVAWQDLAGAFVGAGRCSTVSAGPPQGVPLPLPM
jgi:hypothetical protein